MTCHYCSGSVNAQLDYRRVRGWEHKAPNRRGASDIVLREPFPQEIWACRGCVERLKRGVSLDQESLLGDAA